MSRIVVLALSFSFSLFAGVGTMFPLVRSVARQSFLIGRQQRAKSSKIFSLSAYADAVGTKSRIERTVEEEFSGKERDVQLERLKKIRFLNTCGGAYSNIITTIIAKDYELLELELKAGADPNGLSLLGSTCSAVQTCLDNSDARALRMILQAGAQIGTVREESQLTLLSMLGDYK